jgi:isopenicillin-N epimerase
MSNTLQPPRALRGDLRSDFLIDAGLTFLNHGSFGAALRVVFDEQTVWRRRIEADPIELLGRRRAELVEAAKRPVGDWLGMRAEDFGLVTNATEGINCVLRSLEFAPGDELVTTSHVYNAVRQAMKYAAQRSGATYREIEVPVPVDSPEAVERAVLDGLGQPPQQRGQSHSPSQASENRDSPRRLLVIDHVTSPTALVMPIENIIAGCAKRGVDVLVDGAHGPGMLAMDIGKLAPAYYAGNLHKWTCAPKGCGFVWVRPDRRAIQPPEAVSKLSGRRGQSHFLPRSPENWDSPRQFRSKIHPLVISHHFEQGMAKEFSWQGTRDISAWLAAPLAIEYFAELGWERVMAHNHAMAVWVQQMLCERWNVTPISPADGTMLGAMATVALPAALQRLTENELGELQQRLHDEQRVEGALLRWAGRNYVRPCCQIYNVAEEYERLGEILKEVRGP